MLQQELRASRRPKRRMPFQSYNTSNNGFGGLDGDKGRLRNCNMFCNGSTDNGNDNDNDNDNGNGNGNGNGNVIHEYGFTSLATNLTETNNGVAHQSNIVDELNTLKRQQRQLHRVLFPSNPNDNNINPLAEPDDIVSELTSKVNSLSMTERQEAQKDIYGFQLRNQIEDPTQLSIWMNEMDDHIRKGISTNDNRFSAMRFAMCTHGGYNDDNCDAMGTNMTGAEYVQSQKLKFLRAADWVPETGVFTMAKFFELKLEHFGSESLIRDLAMRDLTPTDIEMWKRYGFLQLSAERDAYGRAIIIIFGQQNLNLHVSTGTWIRCFLYLSTVITRDESLQIAGIICLGWCVGLQVTNDYQTPRLKIECFRGVPLRLVSRQFCYDHEVVRSLILLLASMTPLWGNLRIMCHRGTAMECMYNLMTCGIPRNGVPLNNEGCVKLDFHHAFLETIEQQEANSRKMRRQERLNKQMIQQSLLLQNQILPIGRVGDGHGMKTIEEGDNQLSLNASEIPEMHPAPFGSEGLEDLPQGGLEDLKCASDVLMNHLAEADVSKTTMFSLPTDSKLDELVILPGVSDVLMGRGRHNKKNPGNQKLAQLLESYLDKYEASDKFDKTVLSHTVVTEMKDGNSRFLVRKGQKEHAFWVEAPLEKARLKVSHDFRNLRRHTNAKKQIVATAPFPDVVPSSRTTNSKNDEIGAPKRQRSQNSVAEEQSDTKLVKHLIGGI